MYQEHPSIAGAVIDNHTSRLSSAAPNTLLSGHGAIAALVGAVNGFLRRRATDRALSRLNDHQLRDIGVEPHQIGRAAGGIGQAYLTIAGLDGPARR